MTLRILQGLDCLLHDMGDDHPESPHRLHAIDDQLLISGLEMVCERVDATPASREMLVRAHDADYVDELFARQPETGRVWLDDDTAMCNKTLSAALLASGACCDGVDWVMQGSDRQAFCDVRPPGHHALYDKAMGFCFFNNVVVGARHALAKYGLERIAIVDFDVHHGNGTEAMVAGDERILFFSSFQHPFYPHSGVPAKASNIITAPLDAGSDGAAFRQAISPWFDQLKTFSPELILVSAGFDGHANDPMAYLRLKEEDFFWVSQHIRDIALQCCNGRIVSTLEGGYDLASLASSVVSHLRAISGLR